MDLVDHVDSVVFIDILDLLDILLGPRYSRVASSDHWEAHWARSQGPRGRSLTFSASEHWPHQCSDDDGPLRCWESILDSPALCYLVCRELRPAAVRQRPFSYIQYTASSQGSSCQHSKSQLTLLHIISLHCILTH